MDVLQMNLTQTEGRGIRGGEVGGGLIEQPQQKKAKRNTMEYKNRVALKIENCLAESFACPVMHTDLRRS